MTSMRVTAFLLAVCGILALAASVPAQRANNADRDKAKADAPTEPKELGKLLKLIKPAGEHELGWREIPWMTDVAEARQKAAAEGKLLVHWSMTPHPLGEC